jgi:twitching motility two-component system response regulator PilH
MYHILIVEDSHTYRNVLSIMLQESDWLTSEAWDGVAALEQVAINPPDLILLDVDLPRMSGIEVCRHLKTNPLTQHIPVVLCTGRSEAADPLWGKRQGANACIQKPFRLVELIRTVEALLPLPMTA